MQTDFILCLNMIHYETECLSELFLIIEVQFRSTLVCIISHLIIYVCVYNTFVTILHLYYGKRNIYLIIVYYTSILFLYKTSNSPIKCLGRIYYLDPLVQKLRFLAHVNITCMNLQDTNTHLYTHIEKYNLTYYNIMHQERITQHTIYIYYSINI